jgi:hypothetical protein
MVALKRVLHWSVICNFRCRFMVFCDPFLHFEVGVGKGEGLFSVSMKLSISMVFLATYK